MTKTDDPDKFNQGEIGKVVSQVNDCGNGKYSIYIGLQLGVWLKGRRVSQWTFTVKISLPKYKVMIIQRHWQGNRISPINKA
jgi:hypothetical protein